MLRQNRSTGVTELPFPLLSPCTLNICSRGFPKPSRAGFEGTQEAGENKRGRGSSVAHTETPCISGAAALEMALCLHNPSPTAYDSTFKFSMRRLLGSYEISALEGFTGSRLQNQNPINVSAVDGC